VSFAKNTAVTGFAFTMINRTTGAALTGEAASITGYVTIDGGTQATLGGTIAEEGNGQYSIDLTAAEMNGDIVGLLFVHATGIPASFTIRTTGGSTAAAGESDLSVSFTKLRKEVGWLWLGERNSSNWTADETDQIDCMIASGLRQFYNPPPTEISPTGHAWNFLEPTTTLSTVAGTADYTLPDDFGGIKGDITYAPADSRWYKIEIVSENMIRQVRMKDFNSLTSYPLKAAIRPKTSDGSDGQKWEILFWPEPDQVYTLSYSFYIIPQALSTGNPWPYGGHFHGETILESCLAVAEQRLENQAGIHTAKFRERLLASITLDRLQHLPDSLGYNSDRSGRGAMSEMERRRFAGNDVDYGGTVFYDTNP
jgi:hypothetical protein